MEVIVRPVLISLAIGIFRELTLCAIIKILTYTMDDFRSDRRKHLIEKLVSNARAILSNQVAIPLGVQKMNKIISWIEQIEPLELDLGIFRSYDINTDDLPIGTDRLIWNIEKLIEMEVEFDQANLLFKDDILRKCKEITIVYGQ